MGILTYAGNRLSKLVGDFSVTAWGDDHGYKGVYSISVHRTGDKYSKFVMSFGATSPEELMDIWDHIEARIFQRLAQR